MLRKPDPAKSTREEWVKYSVNNIECAREAIYQTILEHEFYLNGTIALNKKYHLKLHEESAEKNIIENSSDRFVSHTETESHNESSNRDSNFRLDVSKFVEKFEPKSDEFKLLVDKMINTLDMFDAAQENFERNSSDLRASVKDCIGLLFEKLSDYKAPYNDIMHVFTMEQLALLFDLSALALSKGPLIKNTDSELSIPSLNFDTSSIKEKWDESWTNSKKSQYLKEYLSVMLKQVDLIKEGWLQSILFTDESSKNVVQSKFDDFKNTIKSMQEKKAAHDATVPDVYKQSAGSRLSAFFYRGLHHAKSDPLSAHTVNARPK